MCLSADPEYLNAESRTNYSGGLLLKYPGRVGEVRFLLVPVNGKEF